MISSSNINVHKYEADRLRFHIQYQVILYINVHKLFKVLSKTLQKIFKNLQFDSKCLGNNMVLGTDFF